MASALMADALPPSFVNDVEPVLTRFGCNQGACHGKGAGQNGFRLSLRGYAPELDYSWIVREQEGRRVSLVVPQDSLLLRKALGDVPHGGARVFESGSRAHQLLLEWLKAGAPGPDAKEPSVVGLTMTFAESPTDTGRHVFKKGDERTLVVKARYSDDSTRDVTWLTQFASNDPGLVEVDPHGKMKVLRQGETAIRAHYQGQVAVSMVSAPYEKSDTADWPAPIPNNFIDEHVFAKLASLNIPLSVQASDESFLRRVYLDTMVYVLFGGMTATTWVQIIKAIMLLGGATFMAFMVMMQFGFSPEAMFAKAVEIKTGLATTAGKTAEEAATAGQSIMGPGNFVKDPISAISFGMALMFGTAGLPHILMRFFTVPSAKEARKSVMWATGWIGYFYLLTFIIGFGSGSTIPLAVFSSASDCFTITRSARGLSFIVPFLCLSRGTGDSPVIFLRRFTLASP